jgi:hypothetical protein
MRPEERGCMVAAGISSMRGWFSPHLPGVNLRGQIKWMAIELVGGQPGEPAVVLVLPCDTVGDRK